MPTIIMTKWSGQLDGSVRGKVMTFLQKLNVNDTTPGLHVEPIQGAIDPRVRTGRVDDFWRAVMFRLDGDGETHYVVHGVWPHDEAISVARRARLKVNPVNGLPQIEETEPTAGPPQVLQPERHEPAAESLLARLGYEIVDLVEQLGIPHNVAARAMQMTDEDDILELAQHCDTPIGTILVDLAAGDSFQAIIDRMQLEKVSATEQADASLLESLRRPAAQMQFAFIDNQEELRRVIEQGDFGAWRIFLHPEQRRYVERSYRGSFRLTGGAGTGKTVILLHRARALAQRNPDARIILTTFTTNLADALRDNLDRLDPGILLATGLGKPGIYIAGVDSLAAAVLRSHVPGVEEAMRHVLGEVRSSPNLRTPSTRWRETIESSHTDLPTEIANETFLASEYSLIVLPNRIHDEAGYLRVRRPGRGVALDRAKRSAVWALIAAYRAQNRVDGGLDFAEAAAVATARLQDGSDPLADHVLVDEGQDLSPTHWQLLRALAAKGPDDLFIAEDAHQRIYGTRVVLGRYGIEIVGRSQRLTLNYRTTAQNLRYAVSLLDGGGYVDLEQQTETPGYRSARSGPAPRIAKVGSLAEELDAVAAQAKSWLDGGAAPETIAVLVRDQFHRERVVNALAERGVAARAVDRERPPTDRVLVMTMYRAKGMEFARVILAGVGAQSAADRARLDALDETERADAELRARSLLYVAATRARDELTVVQRD